MRKSAGRNKRALSMRIDENRRRMRIDATVQSTGSRVAVCFFVERKRKALLIAASFTFHQQGATSPYQTLGDDDDDDDYYYGNVGKMSLRGGEGRGDRGIRCRGVQRKINLMRVDIDTRVL